MSVFGEDIVREDGSIHAPRLVESMQELKTFSDDKDEVIQDAAAAAMTDSNSINITYDDSGNTISTDVKVDDATVEIDASNGVQVKDAGLAVAKMDSGITTSLGLADSALQSIAPASISTTELDAGVNVSLGKADSALQVVAPGSISTTETDAGVTTSLGLADTALQSVAAGSISTTETDAGVTTSLGLADTALQAVPASSVGSTEMDDPTALVADIGSQDVGAVPDQTSINAAINAVGTKLNDLIAALKTGNVMSVT